MGKGRTERSQGAQKRPPARRPGDEPARESAPTVLVAGGGPAGLAAAAALVSRGLRARLVERAPQLGGKAYSRREAGQSQEHGVHGWWPGYRNFDRLLRECGVDLDAALRPARGGAVLTAPQRFDVLRNPRLRLPSPWFLVRYLLALSSIRVSDLIGSLPFCVHAYAFRHETDYRRYDGISFADLMQQLGVPQRVRTFVLRPFTLCFDYAPPEAVSAASVLSALQFYVLPSQDAIVPRWVRGLPQEKIFGPMARSIADRGGRVDRDVELESVVVEDACVQGAWLRTAAGGAEAPEVVLSLAADQLREGAFSAFDSPAGRILAGRLRGEPRAFSGSCPHAAGPVAWQKDRFECPLHGGSFDVTGRETGGPPTSPLRSFEVRERAGRCEVLASPERSFTACSHVIVATDLNAAREVLARSPGVPARIVRRLARLTTTPIIVVRLWFEPGTKAPDLETIVLPERSHFAEVCFHVNALDPSFDDEGVVIEVHRSDADRLWIDAGDEAILDAVLTDLSGISKDLSRDRLRRPGPSHRIQRHLSVFTLYRKRDFDHRPSEDGGVAGLHLAGDWTRAEWSVWMMERAVVSGLRAANRVLRSHGLEPVEIERPGADGASLSACRWLARTVLSLGWAALPDGEAQSET